MTRPPLFAVSGATGVGKTTATARLPELVPEVLRLDGDLLWSNQYFDRPEDIVRFYGTWLNIAAAIAENGVSLVFCGAVMPSNWEPLPERERIGDIHYLALVCRPDVHEARFRTRALLAGPPRSGLPQPQPVASGERVDDRAADGCVRLDAPDARGDDRGRRRLDPVEAPAVACAT